MRLLVSITSWVAGAKNGEHRAARETYLQDVSRFPELEYKFFVGDGTPTGDDESSLRANWLGSPWETKAKVTELPAKHISYRAKSDEFVLHVPDDYVHLSYKLREQCRWARFNDFDYAFVCAGDTYVDLSRLLSSGFAEHEYSGYWGHGWNEEAGGAYAAGGRGFWLNRRAISVVANASITHWAADLWVGKVLNESGIRLHEDVRYNDYPRMPLKENDLITSHLFGEPTGRYNPNRMYEVHDAFRKSKGVSCGIE
jgi:hypothetical protein